MDASAALDSRQAIAITAEAAAKIVTYAKGDAGLAAGLEEAAREIAQQQGMPAIDAAVVKAALLQVWTRERRLPQPTTVRSSAPPQDEPTPRKPVATIEPAPCESAAAPDTERSREPTASVDVLSEPQIKAPPFQMFGRSESEMRLAAALVLITAGLLILEFISAPAPPIPASPTFGSFDSTRLAEEPSVASSHPPEDTAPPQRSDDSTAARLAAAPTFAPPERPAVTLWMRPEATMSVPSRSVREAQRLLHRLGYGSGPVDGVPGPATTAAVRAFQRDARLAADGTITPALLKALNDQARAKARSEQARHDAPSSRVRSADQPSILGKWLGSVARVLENTYDSRVRPSELKAHCRAVPDDHVFDTATDQLISCALVVGNSGEPTARHTP